MKKELKQIDIHGINRVLFDIEDSKYFIAREISEESINPNSNELNIKYIPLVIIENTKFEAIEFDKNDTIELVNSIFNLIIEFDKPIIDSINEILKIAKQFRDNLTIEEARGIFAELKMIIEFKLTPKQQSRSIYDLSNSQMNDVEVKSFSKVKREIIISYQQLTNNINADFYLVQVFETSEGKSIRELYSQMDTNSKIRYSWIENSNSKLIDEKFDSSELIILKASYFNKGLRLPEGAINAKYTFKI